MNYILGKLLLNNLKKIYDNIKNNRINFNNDNINNENI